MTRHMLVDITDLPDEITPDEIEAVFVQYTTSGGEVKELEVDIVKEERG